MPGTVGTLSSTARTLNTTGSGSGTIGSGTMKLPRIGGAGEGSPYDELSGTCNVEGGSGPRVSKLEAEVKRLETRGAALVKREGAELEGVELLEKALTARSRYSSLQREPWSYGENFVIVCNQLAVRVMQRLGENHIPIAQQLLLHAEKSLTQTHVHDPFAGFHPLRQALHAATLSNFAYLQRLMGEPPEAIVSTLEKAVSIEGTRVSSVTLFNLAVAYSQINQFDSAAETVNKCISLASHHLGLPVTLTTAKDKHHHKWFEAEEAQHAVLGHHLIATLALWTGSCSIARHHSRLALQCATRHLGEEHALTTRCHERLKAAMSDEWSEVFDADDDACPVIPLQMATFASPVPPSSMIPFTLVSPVPLSVVSSQAQEAAAAAVRLVNKQKPTPGGPGAKGRGLRRGGGTSGVIDPTPIASAFRRLGSVEGKLSSPSVPRAPPPPLASPRQTARVPATPTQRTARAGQRLVESADKASVPRPPLQAEQAFREGRPATGTGLSADPDIESSGRPSTHQGGRAPQQAETTVGSTGLPQVFVPQPPKRPKSQSPATYASIAPTTKIMTVIPKSDFEQYVSLQAEVERVVALGSLHPSTRAVQTAGTLVPSTVTTNLSMGGRTANAVGPRWHRGWDEVVATPQLVHREDGAVEFEDVRELLRTGDYHLRLMSTVVPDHTDEEEKLWQLSARKIQRQWAITKARLIVRRRKAAVLRSIEQQEAAVKLQTFCHRLAQLNKARIIVVRKRREKYMKRCATVIQSFANTWLATEQAGAHYLEQLKAERARWLEWKRRECAATVVQSVFRSHRTRLTVGRWQTACETLQRTWRLFRLYSCVRIIVFRRRQRRRDIEAFRHATATKIQRWAHLHVLRLRAKMVLSARRLELTNALQQMFDSEQRYWEQLKTVDEVGCSRRIQRACRRNKEFFECVSWFAEEKHLILAVRRVQRWYRFLTAYRVLSKCRDTVRQTLRVQKRKEEVRESATDIQKIVRGFLARLRMRAVEERIAKRVEAAKVIQRFARRCGYRLQYLTLDEERERRQDRYLLAQLRMYTATKIQSVWKMHQAKVFACQFRTFMHRTRHQLASKIQRVVRQFIARRRRMHLADAFRREVEAESVAELQNSSATRIQKTWKMHKAKSKSYHLLFIPSQERRKAASVIQRIWRKYFAAERIRRLRLDRHATEQTVLNQEHFCVYVIQLQCFARRYILAPRRVQHRQNELREQAATNIQRMVRGQIARERVSSIRHRRWLHADERFSEEEVHFCATRIQKVVRGYLQRKVFATIHRSAIIVTYAFRRFIAVKRVRLLKAEREVIRVETLRKEQDHAATTIQVGWLYHCKQRVHQRPAAKE